MSIYDTFKTEPTVEQSGIRLKYGDTHILVARAGGANSKFRKVFKAKLKPFRRQIDSNTMDDKDADRIMAEAYAEAVVLNWYGRVVDKDGVETWVPTIEGKDGSRMDFTVENVTKLFLDLPELFADVQLMANQAANFRAAEIEADLKN